MPRRKLLLPQIPKPKNQIPMKIQNPNNKNNLENRPRRDLEDRTFQFAQAVRIFVETPPRNISNTEDVRQLVRASGSVAANWIEADEALSKKDFLMRLKILPQRSKREPVVLAFDRRGFVAKHRICSRQISGGGSRIDIDFLCDHLEERI